MLAGLMWGLLESLQIGKKYRSSMDHLHISLDLVSVGREIPVEPWSL